MLITSAIPGLQTTVAGDADKTDLSNSQGPDTGPVKDVVESLEDFGPAKVVDNGFVDVIVFTNDIGELGRALRGIRYEGVIGTASYDGLSTPRLKVPGWAVDIINSLPSTIGVYDYSPPEKHDYRIYEPLSGDYPYPTNIDGIVNHRVPSAWARGFTGEGVEVAIVDDGADMAHPDLLGTAARYNVSRIPAATLDEKPYLSTYDGWPVSYDPTSMSAYFSSGGKAEGGWYANTTSTDDTVWHTIKIDGKNDFWTDGSEKVATDRVDDIIEIVGMEIRQDYNLVDLWVTQDEKNWFFGFTSKANHSTVSFGLYINTTNSPPWTSGATYDPVNGNLITAIANHSPEFAVYMTHRGGQPPGKWEMNDTIDNATVWKWTGSDWGTPVNVTDQPINGQFSYGQYDFKKGEGFVEFSLPKTYLGSPSSISVELFSAASNGSHAQDAVYEDPNVSFPNPDWSNTTTQLSAFTEIHRSYWYHTRNKPGDRAMFSWPIHYVLTGSSKSGQYYFGDHPDENIPQTRVLVVDEMQAGVYDTVYVDLDHNKDFNNDKPLKKYGKYDSSMNWHSPDWNGQGTIYDETSYIDFFDPGGAIRALAFSPNGNWLASGGEDHQIKLWSTAPWSVRWSVNPHQGRPISMAFSPDSSSLAVGFEDPSGGNYSIMIRDTLTGALTKVLQGHGGDVKSLAWSSDGSKLASASADKTARLWTVSDGSSVVMQGHTAAVTGIALRTSDGYMATGSLDGTVRTYDSNGQFLTSYVYGPPLTSITYNPNGTIMATSSTDGNVTLWNAATGQHLNYFLPAHYNNPVLSVRFNKTGRTMVSSSIFSEPTEPTLVTWAVNTWDIFFPRQQGFSACVEGTRGYISHVSVFAPNGTQVASGCGNAVIRLWTLDLNRQGALREHRIGVTDYLRWNTGDGIPDISGGMMYFIAQNYYYSATNTWGTPIPYSDVYSRRNGLETLYIPLNGTLVAFTGALDLNQKHGTLMASSLVGKGVSRYYDSSSSLPFPMDEPTSPQVFGVAPDAKIMIVGNIYTGSIFEGWWFTAQGYDGQPMTGDEPQIAANSFGFSSTFEDGWDFYSRFADYITMVYAKGNLVFTVSAGNDGNGYGTVTSPGSSAGVITAGASTDFFYRKASGLEDGPAQSYGDVVPFSGRGPTALGVPDPDVLANGRMAYGSTPLNLMIPYNGAVASELWSGTSLSSPITAGILALTMQAYNETHGSWPDASTSRSLLMSSCDDINYDIYSQGAGFLNAERAVKLAMGDEGFLVTPSIWTPGNYSGKKYEAFTSLMNPGSSDTATFTVQNVNSANSRLANISTEIFRKVDQTSFAFNTLADTNGDPIDNWFTFTALSPAINPIGTIRNPGVYLLIPPNTMRFMAPLNVSTWINADLIRITAHTNFSSLDGDNDGVLGSAKDFTYMMDMYDWTWDGNTPIIPHTSFTDLNRMSINHPTANVIGMTIHNPALRTHDGLVMGLRRFPYGAGGLYFKITVEYFKKTTWSPFLTLNKSNVTVLPDSTATFTATVTVPPDMPIGNYEGAIYVKGNQQVATKNFEIIRQNTPYVTLNHFNVQTISVKKNSVQQIEGTHYTAYRNAGVLEFNPKLRTGDRMEITYTHDQVVTIPISITVPASGVIFNWTSGIVPGQDELFGNVISSGFGMGGQSGDWRFYPTILPVGGLFDLYRGQRFYAKVGWDLNDTDIDVFSFGPGGSVINVGADLSQERYGPFLVGRNNGGSTRTSLAFTTTGRNIEIASPGLAGGLNIIAIHVVHMNGSMAKENEFGEIGIFGLNPGELNIVTNKLYGSRQFQIFSSASWSGIGAVSAGPVPPERFMNEQVKQDNIEGPDFVGLLVKGSYTKTVRVKPSALIFAVNITSDTDYTDRPCPDLDLGIFLDGKGGTKPDGIAQSEEFVVYSAGPTAKEEIRMIKPPVEDNPQTPEDETVVGAPYIIKVLGYTVPWAPYGTFNMDITLVQGEGFKVEGTTDKPVQPYKLNKVNLTWNLPGSSKPGKMLGALYMGPGDAPLMYLVPITLIIDFTPPEITKFSVSATGNKRVDSETERVTNDRKPSFVVEVMDNDRGELDPTSVKAYLDGRDVTAWTTASFPYTAHPISTLQGRWGGSVRFVPTELLGDGPHSFRISLSDIAGNVVEQDYTVIIDTRAPYLTIDGPRFIHTAQSDITVRGTAEPGATVWIGNMSQVVGSRGTYSFDLLLVPGFNTFTIKAADWFSQSPGGSPLSGNQVELAMSAVYDTESPTLQASVAPSLTTNVETVQVYGLVNDTAAGVVMDPTGLKVRVNGDRAHVRGDGTFNIWVRLGNEGQNPISIVVEDMAGNSDSRTITVIKDTTPPDLIMDNIPGIVTDNVVNISGKVPMNSRVKINGFDATMLSNGRFYREISLSAGMNNIIIRVSDDAGNHVEHRVGVLSTSANSPEAGGSGGFAGISPAAWAAILVVIGVIIGIVLSQFLGSWRPFSKKGPEEGEEEEVPAEQAPEEETPPDETIDEELVDEDIELEEERTAEEEEHAPEQKSKTPEEEKVERLKKAYEEGRISEEVYEENLRRIREGS